MKLEEIEWEDVRLVPLKVRSKKQEDISGIISVSRRPFIFDAVELARAAHTALDPEIKLLLNKSIFSYVKLPVNIRPKDEYDVRFLSIDVILESKNKEAVCWAMEPLRVEQEVKMTTDSTLSGGLKLQGLGIDVSDRTSKEFVFYQPFIEAFGIGQPDPGWEFRPTEGRKLSGVQILHLIVLIPKNTYAIGKVIIKADIFKEGWLWNYQARNRKDAEEVQTIDLSSFTNGKSARKLP